MSQVELKTRTPDSQIGTRLCISGGKFVSQEPEGCPAGSNFMIENLFFNVPARRKFLKSNTTELNNILAAFERIALVYPNIAFTMHSNQVELFSLAGLQQTAAHHRHLWPKNQSGATAAQRRYHAVQDFRLCG